MHVRCRDYPQRNQRCRFYLQRTYCLCTCVADKSATHYCLCTSVADFICNAIYVAENGKHLQCIMLCRYLKFFCFLQRIKMRCRLYLQCYICCSLSLFSCHSLQFCNASCVIDCLQRSVDLRCRKSATHFSASDFLQRNVCCRWFLQRIMRCRYALQIYTFL